MGRAMAASSGVSPAGTLCSAALGGMYRYCAYPPHSAGATLMDVEP